MTESISLRESIERRLSSQIRRDPSLLERLRTDPDGVIRPMIAEALGDDGELDLSAVSTSVHIEGPLHLHLVVTPPTGADDADDADDADEVIGFAVGGMSVGESLRVGSIGFEDAGLGLASKRTMKGQKCGYGATMTLEPECLKDPWGR